MTLNTNLKEIKLDGQDVFVTGNGIYAMRTDWRRLQVRDQSRPYSHKHGRITSKVYATKRVISLEGYIDRTGNDNHQTAFEYLQSLFVLQSDIGELSPRTLYIKDLFDNEWSLPVKVAEPLDIQPYNETNYDIAWKRRVVLESTNDPTYYSTTEQNVVGLESEFGGFAVPCTVPLSMTNYSYYIELTNGGNVETSLRIEIDALNDFTSPIKIKDTTNNKLLQFNTSATAGDKIVIDTGAKTAKKNGSSILGDREAGSVWITFKGTIKLVVYDLDGSIPENDMDINIYFSQCSIIMRVTFLNDKDGNTLTQLFDVIEYDIKLKMNSYSEAVLTISSDDKVSLAQIQYMNEVIIRDESNGVKEVFAGVIYGRSIERNTIELYLRSYEYLLQRRVTTSTTSYSDTVHNIVSTLLAEINGRADTGITLDCGVTDEITVDAQKGQSIYSILENIASKGYEFVIKNKVLYVKEDIGIDRSITGDDYFQLKLDYNDASDRNVVDAKMKGDADSIANAIIGKSTGWSTDATSISTYGRLEDIIATADGGESDLVASEVQRRKDGVTEFAIETEIDDFFFANVGDTLDCYLDRGNGILYYDGTVKLTEKRIKYDERKEIRVVVSTKNFVLENLLSRIQSNTKRIQRLELQ